MIIELGNLTTSVVIQTIAAEHVSVNLTEHINITWPPALKHKPTGVCHAMLLVVFAGEGTIHIGEASFCFYNSMETTRVSDH